MGFEMKTTVITVSRIKYLLLLALSLVFVVGPFASGMDVDDVVLQLCIGLFGLCAAAFAWVIIHPMRLHMNGEGFRVEGGFVRKPKLVRWSEVDSFFVFQPPRSGRIVGYNFKPDSRHVTSMTKVNRAFGADAGLPRGWSKSPDAVAAELNAYRERATRS